MKNLTPLRTLMVAALCLVATSYYSSAADPKVSSKEREEIVSTLDLIYAKFLTGTQVQARSNLLQAIALINTHSCRIPELQEALPISYARLALLERQAGHEALARVYYEKSRYWRIVSREKLAINPEDILESHDLTTRDESDKYALEWDKKRTQGIGPAYLKELK